jgi:small nuclear ribonucleoprotein (snRNP)-like protein
MNQNPLIKRALAFVAVILGTSVSLLADVVETKSGARIVGKIVKIDDGSVIIATDFAGDIKIKQGEVVGITTDAPVAVRLANGTRIDGKVSGGSGNLQVVSSDGTVSTTVDKVAASWAAGGKDPQLVALERKWAYEATVDASGKSGNKSQIGTAGGVRAKLIGVNDTLVFYSNYDRQITDNQKSADQFKAGVDYQNNYSGQSSWYLRNEGGFDRIKDIQFYDVAAFGLGYDFVKQKRQTLTARAGLSFRNENYKNPGTLDVQFGRYRSWAI